MPAKPKHRDAIVAAASRLFRRQGFAGTGLAEIVEASGAPKGSLYHYFPAGKTQIGAAAIAAAGERVSATLESIPEGGKAGDFFREYARRMGGWLRASGFRDGCPVATTVLEEAPRDPGITTAGSRAFDTWRAQMAGRLERRGASTAEAARLALLALAMMEGALILARAAQSEAPLLEAGEAVAAMMDASAKF